MTAPTVGTKLAVVYIIGAMTTVAAAINILHFRERTSVAVIASDIYVGALKQEVRLRVVIEYPDNPGDWVMAIAAGSIKMTIMWINFCMAGSAI